MLKTYNLEQKNFVIDELTKLFQSTSFEIENINITNRSTYKTLYIKTTVNNMTLIDRNNLLHSFAESVNGTFVEKSSLSSAGHVELKSNNTTYKIAFKLANSYRNIDVTDIIEFSQVLLHEYQKTNILVSNIEDLFKKLNIFTNKSTLENFYNKRLISKNKNGKFCHENILLTMFNKCTPMHLEALSNAVSLYRQLTFKYKNIDSIRWCAQDTGYDITADIELILEDRTIVPISIKNYDLRDEIKLKSLAWYHLMPNINHYQTNYKKYANINFSKSSAISAVNLQDSTVVKTIQNMIYAAKPNKYFLNDSIKDLKIFNVYNNSIQDLTDKLSIAANSNLEILQIASNKIKFKSNNLIFNLIVDSDKSINYLLHVKL